MVQEAPGKNLKGTRGSRQISKRHKSLQVKGTIGSLQVNLNGTRGSLQINLKGTRGSRQISKRHKRLQVNLKESFQQIPREF
jgi:hypothetical protein